VTPPPSSGISAADRWSRDLAEWAIPEPILRSAPESPYHFDVRLFASRADASVGSLTPSSERALEALPQGGSVLDIGSGAGAASLPLSARAAELTAVDSSPDMLAAFLERTSSLGVRARTIEGRWPDVAASAPPADVVVCHHVVYNAPDLPSFASRLTDHARHRVVVEMTKTHPLSPMNDLWWRFHGVRRPDDPTTDDAVAVLREAGLAVSRHDWRAPRPGGFSDRRDLIAQIRRGLCLGPDRDAEIEAALGERVVERDGLFALPDRPVSTLWWPGSAS
jgi:SAM-dependent methyltransferase